MTSRNWKRIDVVERIEKGQLTATEAAQIIGLSARQLRRIRRRIEVEGASGVVHGNVKRKPSNVRSDTERLKVVALFKGKYAGFNDQHFTEKLVQEEKIQVSRSTVRRWLREAGEAAARKRRAPKHRRRRDRKPQAGTMMLWDGSTHPWLEDRGPKLCLMAAIDDATSELLPGARFYEQECAAGYLAVLRDVVRVKGVPWVVYQDRHSALKRNDGHWTLEEELQGQQDATQVGKALKELDVKCIFAHSPQAKGRVERLWGTLQDRWVSELKVAGVTTIHEANEALERLTVQHNKLFAVKPQDATPAWRPLAPGLDINKVCSFRYAATVNNDNTVRLDGIIIDIPPGPRLRTYAKARVDVRQLLDGTWMVLHKDKVIARKQASSTEELRAKPQRKRSAASMAFRKAVISI